MMFLQAWNCVSLVTYAPVTGNLYNTLLPITPGGGYYIIKSGLVVVVAFKLLVMVARVTSEYVVCVQGAL